MNGQEACRERSTVDAARKLQRLYSMQTHRIADMIVPPPSCMGASMYMGAQGHMYLSPLQVSERTKYALLPSGLTGLLHLRGCMTCL